MNRRGDIEISLEFLASIVLILAMIGYIPYAYSNTAEPVMAGMDVSALASQMDMLCLCAVNCTLTVPCTAEKVLFNADRVTVINSGLRGESSLNAFYMRPANTLLPIEEVDCSEASNITLTKTTYTNGACQIEVSAG